MHADISIRHDWIFMLMNSDIENVDSEKQVWVDNESGNLQTIPDYKIDGAWYCDTKLFWFCFRWIDLNPEDECLP